MTKTKSKPYAMTENDRSLVSMALRNKATGDSEFAEAATDKRLADQFRRQATQAAALADKIDEADLVDVWPYDED
jgi:hypothetical protein